MGVLGERSPPNTPYFNPYPPFPLILRCYPEFYLAAQWGCRGASVNRRVSEKGGFRGSASSGITRLFTK